MKDTIKGFVQWSNRVQNINVIITPITSGFLLVINYLHLVPAKITWINYLLLFVYLLLYISLFTTIVSRQLKKAHEMNAEKLRMDIEELKK